MSDGMVSVLIPILGSASGDLAEQRCAIDEQRSAIESYLETTGFQCEVLPVCAEKSEGLGALLRKGVAEARGSTIVVVDPAQPYALGAIGDAVAMVRAGNADIVFGTTRSGSERDVNEALLRWVLVPILPDPTLRLKAFSSEAARVVIGESKLVGDGCDLEIAYLANKYGLRIEQLRVHCETPPNASPRLRLVSSLLAAMSIRLNDRRMTYRAPRRCPVCFSSEVWSCAQIPGNIVRACTRCKCRYLNEFHSDGQTLPVRRDISSPLAQFDPGEETQSVRSARERTSGRRLGVLRRYLPPRARMLHAGVGDGSFGVAASRDYEYVGIDAAPAAARAARGRGLEAYCATISNFVNTGPPFDAVVLFHVFEDMPEPHDSLARIKDLLKPGGTLLLTAFDTEGLVYLVTERRRMVQNFHAHQILYSRSALIELLERSGFEIESIGPDFEYRDQKFLRYQATARWPSLAPILLPLLRLLPNPLLISSGSMRVIAKRRAGSPEYLRTVRSV